jgi:hypothetical protein
MKFYKLLFSLVLSFVYTAILPSQTLFNSQTYAGVTEPAGHATVLYFSLALNGIGSSGDKRNSKDASLSNKNPVTQQREVQVFLDTNTDAPVLTTTLPVTYDSATGIFKGQLLLGHDVASGSYKIKVKTSGYLMQVVPGTVTITQQQITQLPAIELIAGDVSDDNKIDALDYNFLLDCGYGDIEPIQMDDPKSDFNSGKCQSHKNAKNADLDDNGIIDSKDYNLFLREF